MADKSFGVRQLNLVGVGTPSIESSTDLVINTNGSERVRIDSNGRTNISDAAITNDDFQLQIESPESRPASKFYRKRNTAGGGLLAMYDDVGATETLEYTFATGGNLTLHKGNLVIGTSGQGIDFSATADGGTTTSELLNDYEEGTWTPTVVASTGSPSIDSSGRSGTYTRIGRAVILYGRFQISATTGTGRRAVEISNLPFVQGDNAASSMGICSNYPKGDAHGHGGIIVNNTGSNNTTWYAEWYNDINQTVGSPVSFQITYYTS